MPERDSAPGGRGAITRRRALTVGALAGLGSFVAAPLRAVPALAASRAPRARGFGLNVTPADFAGRRTSRVLRAPRRFDLLGLRGSGHMEVRVRKQGGAWSRWVPLAVHGDHAPDTGTGERASDPVWSGGSDEFQLRAPQPPDRTLRVHFVSIPASARRRRLHPRVRARAARQQPGAPPPIIPRAAWGAAAVPPRARPSYGTVQLAFVHHTVTANSYSPQQSAGIVLAIAKYHRDTNGWNDIGYNFLVDQYGQVFEGRAGGVDAAVIGAQAQGFNSVSTGVAQLGTFTSAGISDAAMAATAQLLGWKLSLHGVPTQGTVTVVSAGGATNRYRAGTPVTLQRISGHRDGDRTSCPGDALFAQLPTLRARASARSGPAAPTGRVTLAAAATEVPFAAQVAFSGSVFRPDGTPGAFETVDVQRREAGTWVTVARTTAAADGTWAAERSWRRGGRVRAQAAGATSPATRVRVIPRVVVRRGPARRRVLPGATVHLRGRVRPATPVQVLVEVRGADGQYRRVREVGVRRRRFTWKAAVKLGGPGRYRLTAHTKSTRARGVAEPVFVRVARGAARL
jgi:N-acetylmuramoyl-L-alanine amidase